MNQLSDERGVVDLPLRLVVTMIFGAIILGLIVYYISTNCFLMKNMQVAWKPSLVEINGGNGKCEIEIRVKDEKGNPLRNAVVTVMGLGGADSEITGKDGKVILHLNITIGERREGYLNIKVSYNSCYRDFYEENAIKVVRVD